jgi:peptidoglycan/xylan/chitin deacetylase (PgdA/CDA1 family)
MATEPTATNLLFHRVVEGGGRGEPPGAISVDRLEARIRELLESGVEPARLVDYARGRAPGPDRFTVSFDDADPSVASLAAPLLERLGVPATVFVPTGHTGRTPLTLGWPQLRELVVRGWDVGSHASRHERLGWRLYDEDEAAWERRVRRSAARSLDDLSDHLGIEAELFAWPFGEAPRGVRRAVSEAGFRAAFSVDVTTSWDGDPLAIPRLDGVPEQSDIDPTPGISVVVPTCDRLGVLREVVRRLADQSYPEELFEVIVVNDGGDPEALSEALAPWLCSRVRIAQLPEADGRFRAGQARQLGAERAGFDVVAFLDADVAVDADFLWHLAWVHARDPRAVLLGYLSGYNLHDLGLRHDLCDVARADRLTGDALPVIPDRSREPSLQACFDNIALLDDPWTLAYTGNLSLRRSLLAEAGGFATEFDGWGFEDVDLGIRLHAVGVRWIFSRFALGYHVADPDEVAGASIPRNPFRQETPEASAFDGVLRNLGILESQHPGRRDVAGFAAQVRADIDEICGRPYTVGVDVRGPGGFPLHQILDRVAYAKRVGARELYVLGPGVATREDLESVAAAAALSGLSLAMEVEADLATEGGVIDRLQRLGIDPRIV